MHGKITFWQRLRVGLMLGIKAFRKGFAVGDTLTVTYSLVVK